MNPPYQNPAVHGALLATAAFILASEVDAASITYVGHQDGVELDANDPTVGWRNTSPAKPLDIDGDNILGSDGYALAEEKGSPSYKLNPSYASVKVIAPNAKSNNSWGAWDAPGDPSGDDTVKPGYYFNNDGNTVDALEVEVTGSGLLGETLRLGILYGATGTASNTYTVAQTVGGTNEMVTTPALSHDGSALNVAYFNITGAVDGDKFLIRCTGSAANLEQISGITLDSATTSPATELPEVVGTTRGTYDTSVPLDIFEFFADDGVLQRDQVLPVWGWDDPGTQVTVQFAGQTVITTTDADGRWSANLQPLTLNATPQDMTVSTSGESLTIQNLLIGDVWLCAGQSNMEMDFNGNLYQAVLPSFVNPDDWDLIRHVKVSAVSEGEIPDDVLNSPQERLHPSQTPISWKISNAQDHADFTAVGYFFAYTLANELGIPIGLVNTTRGNTRIDSFLSPASAALIEDEVPESQLKGIFNPNPFTVYNMLLSPVGGFGIKGGLWYQGEAQAKSERDAYYWKMTALVQGWRDVWGQGDFPFYYVQLPSYDQGSNANWAPFREAQARALDIVNSGMAVTTDLGETLWENPNALHPRNKYDVGRRLALWALAKDYGDTDLVYSGPFFQSAVEDNGSVLLTFEHVGSGLQAAQKPLDTSLDPNPAFSSSDPPVAVADLVGFEVASSDDQWYAADASIQGTTVVLSAQEVSQPTQARYNYAHNTDAGTFYNLEGLPGAPFFEATTTPTSVPDVPSNLTATAGVAQVLLSWDASASATGYNIKRATQQGGPYATIATSTGNTYTDASTTSSIPYYYVVSAVNNIGESADSTEASATPEVPTEVPPAPTGLNAVGGNARVDLAWDVTPTAASYKVKRSTSQGGSYTIIDTTTATSYADTSAVNGTTYFYVVSGVNIIGEGGDSAEANATPEEPVAPPDTPTGLGATAGDGQVDLSWDVSILASSYHVKRSTTQGGPYTTIASPVTNSYADATAVNNTTYYYVVSAANGSGESVDSSEVSATPFAPVPPSAPTGLNATGADARVNLNWNAVATATSYNVKRSTTQGGSYTTIATPTTANFADNAVVNGTIYHYVVSAVNGFGESADSTEASATPEVVTSSIDFSDPSFENGGTIDMSDTTAGDFYAAGGGINTNWTALSSLVAGKWYSRQENDGGSTYRNGGLERRDGYRTGQATDPAGVTGDQWYMVSRANNQSRSLMQYVDTGGTSGDVTISIDHWSHELGGGTPAGSTQLSFQIFAFNDPSQVGFMHSSVTNGPYDPIRGTGDGGSTWVEGLNYATTGLTFETLDAVDAATGFDTLTKTLSLGATSYQYVGVAFAFLGDDANGSNGEVTAIDNLVVSTGSSDTTPPSWESGYPLVDNVTSSGATARGQIDEDGTAYFVVLTDGAAAPDSAEVKGATGDGGAAAVASGGIVLTASTFNTAAITGLDPGTAYDIYFVAEDGVPNLQASPTLVEITTPTLYVEWSDGGGGFSADDNLDGVANGLAWLLGASSPAANARGLLPQSAMVNGDLTLDFHSLNLANRGDAQVFVEYSRDLGLNDPWTQALVPETSGGLNGVDFVITPNGDLNRVQVTIPASAAAPGGSIFGRVVGDDAP